jgi:uncharacterized repeat protein (TIGR01451 family)
MYGQKRRRVQRQTGHGIHVAPRSSRRSGVWRALAVTGVMASTLFGVVAASPLAARADSGSTLPGSPFNGSDGKLDTTPAGVISTNPDPFNTSSDNIFGSSPQAKEDQVCPEIGIGNVDNKDDLKSFSIGVAKGTSTATASTDFLYLAWSRVGTSGDANIDFELNQSTSTATCTDPTVNKVRTPGDILIQYNDTSTTGVVTITAYKWVTSGTCDIGNGSAPCWELSTLNPATTEASVSSDKSFGEMVINLEASGIFQTNVCTNLGSAFAKSRASTSGDAALKDYVFPVAVDIENCAPTTTTTSPSVTSLDLGGSLKDSVKVTGNPTQGPPTGDVTFYVCSGTTTGCDPTSAGAQKLTGTPNPAPLTPATGTGADTSTATSPSFTPPAPGNYCFAGVYTPTAGTAIYFGSSDTSADECFVVNKLTPGFTTSPSQTTITLGGSVTDTATATGTSAGGVPTGTVSWTFCDGGTCTAAPTTATSSSGTDPATFTSTSVTPTKVGTWCFSASFTSTNANYNSVGVETNPTDECVTVNPATSKTATQISTDKITLSNSGSVSDTVTVTGNAAGGSPTGIVAFYVCQTGTAASTLQPGFCPPGTSTSVAATGGLTASGDGTTSNTSSTSFKPTSAGTWCFSAVYKGDLNYLGSEDNTTADNTDSLECVLVATAPTTTSTAVVDETKAGAFALGDRVHDTSTVSGQVGETLPTGSVTYYSFTGTSACPSDGTTGAASSDTVTLSGGIVPKSTTQGPLTAGMYAYDAVYSGDGNYSGSISSCEPFSIAQGPSTTATAVVDETTVGAFALGDRVHDTSTVSGSPFTPTGSVTYYFFTGTSACPSDGTTGAASSDTVTLSGGIVPKSTTHGPLTAGMYAYDAVYSGDGNYSGSISSCEPFTVSQGSSSTGTVVFDAKTNAAWTNTEAAPTSAYDTATVSGTPDAFTPTGTVDYTFFKNGDCGMSEDSSGTPAGSVTITSSGAVPNSETENALAPGSYSFQASYGGDMNYTGSMGPCEPFTVLVPATVTPVKSSVPPDGSVVALGSTVVYTITLSNSGQVDATNVRVTDKVPAGTTFVTGSAGVDGTADPSLAPDGSGVITWSGLTVPKNAGTRSVEFSVTINKNDADGVAIPNHAIVTNVNTPGCISSSDTTDATCDTNTVTVTPEFPVITAVKSSNPPDGSLVKKGDLVVYKITLSNTGMQDATNVTVTDAVPAGTTVVSADDGGSQSAGTVTWSGLTVAAGKSTAVSFTVTINANDTNGEVIPNVALFTDVNTPNCNGAATCNTNQVKVILNAEAPAQATTTTTSTAPPATPAPPATTAPKQPLAFTGSDVFRATAAGLVGLVLGSILVMASRRRRRQG